MRTLLAALLFLALAACQYSPPGPAGPRFDAALRDELITLEARDLALRSPAPPAEFQSRAAQLDRTTRANQTRLREILDSRGWPDRATVGSSGARAAWTIALHADTDPALQRRCLDLMQQAQARGEASPAAVAYLTDRVLVNQGKPQIYGTQFTSEGGEPKAHPIADTTNLDARRAHAGLPPMAEYDRMIREAAAKARQSTGS